MPNYRRYYLPHRPVFVTLVTHARQPWLTTNENIAWLRICWQRVKTQHPFRHIAHVILPDHIHWLFEPTGESNFSAIVAAFKRDVTWSVKRDHVGKGLPTNRLWQARFYEHLIRDQEDLNRHLDYIHYNPVKHGLVMRPTDYPYSSLVSWQQRGFYDEQWGEREPLTIQTMNLE